MAMNNYGGAEACVFSTTNGWEKPAFSGTVGGLDVNFNDKRFAKNSSTLPVSPVAFKSLHWALHVEVFILFCNDLYFSSKALTFFCNE